MNRQIFLRLFGHIAYTPGGIDKLRQLVLDLAVQGRLSGPEDSDDNVTELLAGSAERKLELVARGVIPKPNRLLSGASIEEPFNLPTLWEWSRIEEVAAYVQRGKSPSYVDRSSVPVISQKCVQLSGFDGTRIRFAAESSLEKYGRERFLVPGDLLWNSTGTGTVGRVVVYGGMREFARVVADSHVTVIRSLACLPNFLWVWLSSTFVQDQMNDLTTGTTQQQELNAATIRRLRVPVPPKAEQQRIVKRVHELLALCEGLKEQLVVCTEARSTLTAATLNRVTKAETADDLLAATNSFAEKIDLHLAPGDGDLAALKRLRQTILDLAVRGRLTSQEPGDEPAIELLDQIAVERDRLVKAKEIRKPKPVPHLELADTEFTAPPGWMWQRLGSLNLSSDSGWSPACVPSTRTDEGQWAVLKVSSVSWGKFRADEHKLLTPGLDPRPQIEVKDGDFTMSRANTVDLVGRSVVAADPPPHLMLSDKLVRLRFRDRITAEFANLVNGSSRARSYYGAVATGTSDSMRNITRDQILALPVAVPPLCEQARIVSRVSHLNAICDQLEKQLQAAQALRGDLATSVIAHATPQREAGID